MVNGPLGRSENMNTTPSLGFPGTVHKTMLFNVTMSVPVIVAIPPRMEVPLGMSLTPKRSHVSELVPTNGGTTVTCADVVSANNKQSVAESKHAMQTLRLLPR